MFWNQKYLACPPVNTYKCTYQKLDFTKFRNALQEAITHFNNGDFLSAEAALLSRILYRMKMKFRNSKDFKLLEKLNRCLNIYLNTGLNVHLKTLLDLLPFKYTKETYLPSKNMLLYILVRLQGIVKLMEQIYDTCLILAKELMQRFLVGHFWKLLYILFAIVSRVFVLVRANTKFLCDFYGKLLPYSNKLKHIGAEWIPKNYNLPTDLRLWLNVQWVNEDDFVDLTFDLPNTITDYLNLVNINDDDDEEVVFCDEYILLNDEEEKIVKDAEKLLSSKDATSENNEEVSGTLSEEDIGNEITNEEVFEIDESIISINDDQEEESVIIVENNKKSKNRKSLKRKSIVQLQTGTDAKKMKLIQTKKLKKKQKKLKKKRKLLCM